MSIPPDEHRELWNEAWSEARKAKAERRKRNQQAWADSPLNAQNQRKQAFAAVTASEIPIDLNSEVIQSGTTESLAKLRTIMASPAIPTHRRLDAAELLISFEVPSGGVSNVDPDQVAAGSYQFLRTIVDSEEVPEPLRFRALKAIAIVENARASIKASSVTHTAKRELLLRLINAQRTLAFRAAGTWHEAVKTTEWALTNADAFDWPKGWPGDWVWPPATFAVPLEQAFDVTAFRELLLSIRATNRADDDWERFLKPTS